MPQTSVGAGCGLFDKRKRFDELREVADRHTRDREVLDGPQRVDAPVGLSRDIHLSKQIVLASCGHLRQLDRARGRDLNRFGGRHLGPRCVCLRF